MDRYLLIKINQFEEVSGIKLFKNFNEGKRYCIENFGYFNDLGFVYENDKYFLIVLNEKKLNFSVNN